MPVRGVISSRIPPVPCQCPTSAPPVFRQCPTRASPVSRQCPAIVAQMFPPSVAPVLHQCPTRAPPVSHPCPAGVPPVPRQCPTRAPPVCHPCPTSVSPVPRQCLARVSPVPRKRPASIPPVFRPCPADLIMLSSATADEYLEKDAQSYRPISFYIAPYSFTSEELIYEMISHRRNLLMFFMNISREGGRHGNKYLVYLMKIMCLSNIEILWYND